MGAAVEQKWWQAFKIQHFRARFQLEMETSQRGRGNLKTRSFLGPLDLLKFMAALRWFSIEPQGFFGEKDLGILMDENLGRAIRECWEP